MSRISVTYPHVFAGISGNQPASLLDDNFQAVANGDVTIQSKVLTSSYQILTSDNFSTFICSPAAPMSLTLPPAVTNFSFQFFNTSAEPWSGTIRAVTLNGTIVVAGQVVANPVFPGNFNNAVNVIGGLVVFDGSQWLMYPLPFSMLSASALSSDFMKQFFFTSVKNFGAVGDALTDDTAAFQNALASGLKSIFVPTGTYIISAKLTLPTGVCLWGMNGLPPTLLKGANGDMLDMTANRTAIRGLTLTGASGVRTGRGVVISGGTDQLIYDCVITDMDGYCLEFDVENAGLRFRAQNTIFQRGVSTNPAVKMPTTVVGASESSGNRYFNNCGTGGGNFMDLASSANVLIQGCNFSSTTGLTFTAKTSRCLVQGCRIAILSGTLTIDGFDHNISGNIIAGDITLATTSARCFVGLNNMLTGASVTDNSTATDDNVNEVWAQKINFTPVWKGDGSDPAIVNGAIVGRVYRNGRMVTMSVTLTIGAATTFGTGQWYFTLPAPYDVWLAKAPYVGSAQLFRSGVAFYVGIATISGGTNKVYIFSDGGTAGVQATIPFTWAVNDVLNFTVSFEIGG